MRTLEGKLRGYRHGSLNVFKGVRYGESTGGIGRFKAPRPVQPWQGLRDARTLGSPSAQISQDLPAWQDPLLPGSEDCLFLNIWAPREASALLPVMVFIHGGGYQTGSGGVPLYDCEALAETTGTLVVNLNHRLNIFGYLYLGELTDAFDANAGQLDLIEALRWVRRNISAFGGDPSNITIFGESGGGMKISTLMGMPAARGQIDKAIIQSGSQLEVRSKEHATREARAVLAALDIPVSEIERLADVSTEQLLEVYAKVIADTMATPLDTAPFSPVFDGVSLPWQLEEEASRALWADVPLLVGTNASEAALYFYPQTRLPTFPDDASVLDTLHSITGISDKACLASLVTTYRDLHPGAARADIVLELGTLSWMWNKAVRQAELKAQTGGAPVYMYLFGWKDPLLGGHYATHATELAFLFDHLELNGIWDESDIAANRAASDPEGLRFKLRRTMMECWAAFAARGVPNAPLASTWPAYSEPSRVTMWLDGQTRLLNDPYGPTLRRAVTTRI